MATAQGVMLVEMEMGTARSLNAEIIWMCLVGS